MFRDVLGEANVSVGMTRKRIPPVLAVVLLLAGGFAFGFVSCLHLKDTTSSDRRHQYLLQAGDAPAPVRAEVLTALRAFQEGYIRRDPRELDSFMHRLFPENDDILLLGTDADEWVRGYRAAAEFIKTDWLKWGISGSRSTIPSSALPGMSPGLRAREWSTVSGRIAPCDFQRS